MMTAPAAAPQPTPAAERIPLNEMADYLAGRGIEPAEWLIDGRRPPFLQVVLIEVRPRGIGGPVRVTQLG